VKLRGYMTGCALGLAACAVLLTGRIKAESPRNPSPPSSHTVRLKQASGEQVVYVNTPSPSKGPIIAQIYKMDADGSRPVNLSNNHFYDSSPNVHRQTKQIVFFSTRPPGGLHTMDVDGGNVQLIPNIPFVPLVPKWSKSASDPFIIFAATETHNSSIYLIRPDGTNLTKLTNPGADEADENAEVVADDKYIVFTRLRWLNRFDRDLFLKSIGDDRPAVNLTNTHEITETMPVVSHDGKRIAYRVVDGVEEQIHVATLDTATQSLYVLHTIRPIYPATPYNIGGIDFSTDDTRLYFSVEVNDVMEKVINRRQEIFSIKLDGSEQHRLTRNNQQDGGSSVVSP
jgi:Tol biopolymer transport system component